MSIRAALQAAGAGPKAAAAQAPLAEAAMIEADITTNVRARFFIAQVMHESGGLFYREELASGQDYEGRRDLGNTQPGDGRRYKGRGWIQLTGRSNYRAAGKALGLPLEAKPEIAAQPAVAWRIATWYWSTRGLNALADAHDFLAVTKRINGGTNGLDDRRRRLGLIERIDCRPARHPWDGYSKELVKLLRTYDDWTRRGVNPEGVKRLRHQMTILRKQLWRAAQAKPKGDGAGWTDLRRRKYESLKARTL